LSTVRLAIVRLIRRQPSAARPQSSVKPASVPPTTGERQAPRSSAVQRQARQRPHGEAREPCPRPSNALRVDRPRSSAKARQAQPVRALMVSHTNHAHGRQTSSGSFALGRPAQSRQPSASRRPPRSSTLALAPEKLICERSRLQALPPTLIETCAKPLIPLYLPSEIPAFPGIASKQFADRK
jgi:hypothetical protein